ncbi:PQQ-binding-like beta-propeller repeat protein [Methanolobus sp. ZRKC2]|uniref:outer membrane protein assembly factor BamB family protein n=1 Tax=Methanolobus sp. ZRKC2 TaxID=3125783 RepID=UPI003250669B
MITKGKKGSLTFIMGILLILLLLPSAASASDWETFQKDNYNNGITSDKAPITNPVGNGISWENSYTLGGSWSGFDNVPLVIGDIVYMVGDDNKLRAIYKVNGTEKWATSTSGGRVLGNMAAGNGSIFVPTSDGNMFAIDMYTGTVQWSATETGQIITPVIYEDHRIYFGDMNAQKYFCYNDNGTKVWERATTTGGTYYWAGAAPIGDCLIYGDDAGYLVSVYKANGTLVDSLDVSTEFGVTANEIRSAVNYVEDLDRIYFTSKSGYVYALGMNPDGTFDTTDKAHENIGYSTSTPVVYKGKVYVGCSGGLHCLYANNLTKDWHFPVSGQVQSSPVISTAYDDGDGEIYIYFTENWGADGVFCINESGVEQWSYGDIAKTEYTLCGVAISDGWIFFGTDADYAFGFATADSIAEEPNTIYIDDNMNLQDVIYAAENGDTIMMAPGTYYFSLPWYNAGETALYINKSDLTFMADGGEVIITDDASSTYSLIISGRENASDTLGCDASGTAFYGITFDGVDKIGRSIEDWLVNQDGTSLRFEDCTINGNYVTLTHNSVIKSCSLDLGTKYVYIEGDNVLFEDNVGSNTKLKGGSYANKLSISADCVNVTIRNNKLTNSYISYKYGDCLFENNVIDGSGFYIYGNASNVIRDNELSGGSMKLEGQVYNNDMSYTGTSTSKYVQFYEGGTYYLNNIEGNFAAPRLYPATYSTPAPVVYNYAGASHTGHLGNYYSNYAGNDNNGNGIGDDSMTSSYGGIEEYPLVGAWDEATDTIATPGGLIFIDESMNLQDVIYAAENGDTIMMAPGTYNNSGDLYINKSSLSFIANGGEVIITPDAGTTPAYIKPGRENSSETTGCDGSGITFNGITIGDFGLRPDGSEYEPDNLIPNQIINNLTFEGCTFLEGYNIYETYICLYDDSSVLDCTFSGLRRLNVEGHNVRIEGNSGTGLNLYEGDWDVDGVDIVGQNMIFRNNILTAADDLSCSATSLVENNVIDGVDKVKFRDGLETTNIIRNNTFLNVTGDMFFDGTIYQNEATLIDSGEYVYFYYNSTAYLNDFTYVGGVGRVQMREGTTAYLNNFNGAYAYKLYTGINCSTPYPVTYTYGGVSHTGYLGNYYSEYAGIDTNVDGVGDDNITSSYGGAEEYPLMGAWDAASHKIAIPPEPPEAPVVSIGSEGDRYVYLDWDEPASDESISSYNIYKGTSSGAGSLYETIAADITGFIDHDVTNGQTYYYQVSAVSSLGEGDLSTEVTGSPIAEVVDDSWEHFMGDLQHTGYSSTPGPKTNATLWESADIDAEDGASITIAEDLGLMFVISDYKENSWATDGYNNLSALDINDGSVVWSVTFGNGSNYNSYDSWATPAYHNGVVFTAGDGARYANNGTLIWGSMPMNTNGGPLVAEGKVIVGNWDGAQYFCLDEETGAELWNISVNGNAQGTPAYNNSYLFLTSYDEVNCVDMDGNVVWTRAIDNVMGSAAVKYGLVYITTYDMSWGTQYVYALDEITGDVVWQSSMAGQMIGTDCTPAVAYGYVYVTAGMAMIDQHTFCFDAFTGDVVWTSDEAGSWFTSPVVSDGVVYAGAESYFTDSGGMGSFTRTVALDAFDGSLIWESDLGGSTPALHNGVLYTVGFQKVYAFGEETGDWNPWNDPGSDDGELISFAEVMEAYNCFVDQTGAPGTGADIDFATVMVMYNAFIDQVPM